MPRGTSFHSIALITFAGAAAAHAQGDTPREVVTAVVVGRSETAQLSLSWDGALADGGPLLGHSVPLDSPWMIGSTAPPVLTTTLPLRLGALQIPAGSFNLWARITADSATLIVSNRGDEDPRTFNPGLVIGTAPLTADSSSTPVLRLTMLVRIDRVGPDTNGVEADRSGRHETIILHPGTVATLIIAWGRFRWSVPLSAL
jgi:hypothetical protein